jgi:hypothetical protein
MSYTAYTAFIFTFHHLSTFVAGALAFIVSALIYWVFVRRRKNRLLIILMVYIGAFVLGSYFADELFHKTPISFEMVNTD